MTHDFLPALVLFSMLFFFLILSMLFAFAIGHAVQEIFGLALQSIQHEHKKPVLTGAKAANTRLWADSEEKASGH